MSDYKKFRDVLPDNTVLKSNIKNLDITLSKNKDKKKDDDLSEDILVQNMYDDINIKGFDIDAVKSNNDCIKYMFNILPFTERLLRKNAVHLRILLSFDRLMRILNFDIADQMEKSDIMLKIRKLCKIIQNYFDKIQIIEHEIIYPLYENTKYKALVEVLKKQSITGDILIGHIYKSVDKNNIKDTIRYVSDYIYMYRAFISREDTIIFNVARKVIDARKFLDTSYKLKVEIIKNYGKNWRKSVLTELIDIEKSININNLSQYTPILDPKAINFLDKKHFTVD